jgi:hypothetical protein
MRVRKLSLVRCLVWVVVVFGSGTALAKTDGSGGPGSPREHARDGNSLLVYQPQVDDWKYFHGLTWRIAVSLTPKGGKEGVGVPHSGHGIAIADELSDLASQIRAIVAAREAVSLIANYSFAIPQVEMRRRSASMT